MKTSTDLKEKEEITSLSLDFIAGLVSGGGTFMWVKQNSKDSPVFQLKMQAKDKRLLENIKKRLGLSEKVYEYRHQGRHYVLLLVRKRSVIENAIFPAFDERLFGAKKDQYDKWKKRFYEQKFFE